MTKSTKGLTVRLAAPVRGSHGNAAAMAFEVDAPAPGGARVTIRVIDVMTFNAQGQFSSMRAFWAPDDMDPGWAVGCRALGLSRTALVQSDD